jgi:hypothetical protein
MRRTKSTARRSHIVAASSSISEDNMSLDAIKKRHLHQLAMLSLPARFHSAEAVCLHSGIDSPASTRYIGRTTFQCKFVLVLVFFLIIT